MDSVSNGGFKSLNEFDFLIRESIMDEYEILDNNFVEGEGFWNNYGILRFVVKKHSIGMFLNGMRKGGFRFGKLSEGK